jgi:hypothetical protein
MTNSGKRQSYNLRGAMLAAAVAVIVAGCNFFNKPPVDEPEPLPEIKCACPNGSVHFVDEACCPGGKTKDCTCTTKPRPQVPAACTHGEAEYLPGNHQTLPHGADCKCKNIPGTVVNTIPVTNRENLSSASFNTMADRVGDAFTTLTNLAPEDVPIVKNNIKEIRIIQPGVGAAPVFTLEGGKYIVTVREGVPANDIATAFHSFVLTNPQLTAAVQQQSAKNIIRLAMHGKHGNKPAFDFDFRTNTITQRRMASVTQTVSGVEMRLTPLR